MKFIDVLRLLNEGKYITRSNWTKNMYIYAKNGKIINESCHYITLNIDAMLQEDWQVYEEQPKTYSFQEAFDAFTKYKKIKRKSKERVHSIKNYTNLAYHKTNPTFSYDDIIATDWTIEDEL